MTLLTHQYTIRVVATILALAILAGGCGGTTEESTTQAPPSTTVATEVTQAPTTQLSATTTEKPDLTFAFEQRSAETDEYVYDIAYPLLVHPDGAIADAVNSEIQAWVDAAILEVSSADVSPKASLSAQIAPELLNSDVFSVSGVSTSFTASPSGTIGGRIAWIFSLTDGALVAATELMADGDLTPLAEAATAHLIDVLGDDGAIVAPDGLLPDPANFDAVWLTATGVGIGFDQFQVAAGSAGSPSVLIPFADLDGSLNTAGVLAPLASGTQLPAR